MTPLTLYYGILRITVDKPHFRSYLDLERLVPEQVKEIRRQKDLEAQQRL